MNKKLNEQIVRIKSVMGIINEQKKVQSTISVPQKAIDIIKSIESKYSYYLNGIQSRPELKGDEVIPFMNNYINETIGVDCWNKMSEKLRSQIYSFCYQSDSGPNYKMRFIAGLAQAIDKTINRLDIVNKPLNDPNVQNAIKIIKNACNNGTIDNYYDNYLSIVDNQYAGIKMNNSAENYKYIWKYRPIAIDRAMNGEDMNTILKDWQNSFNNNVNTTNKTNIVNNQEKIEINGPMDDLMKFREEIKTKTAGKKIKKVAFDMDRRKAIFYIDPNAPEINKVTLVWNLPSEGDSCPSCEATERANAGKIEVLHRGKWENDTRYFSLYLINK